MRLADLEIRLEVEAVGDGDEVVSTLDERWDDGRHDNIRCAFVCLVVKCKVWLGDVGESVVDADAFVRGCALRVKGVLGMVSGVFAVWKKTHPRSSSRLSCRVSPGCS